MKIVCFGDSLTAAGGHDGRFSDILQQRFPRLQVVNAGYGGKTLAEARLLLESDILPLRPDLVLLEFGANDWWQDVRPPEAWGADLEAMLFRLQQAGCRVLVLGVFGPWRDPHSGAERRKEIGADARSEHYAALEAEICRRHGVPRIANIQADFLTDRCCWHDRNHPNELGNRLVANNIEAEIERLSGDRSNRARAAIPRTLRDFWNEAIALAPGQTAVIDGAQRLTYAEADQRCAALAAGICRLTGSPRPRVAVCLPNCLDYYLLYWALAKVGGIIVPVNPWLKADSLQEIYRTVDPQLLVVQDSGDTEALTAAATRPALPIVTRGDAAGIAGALPLAALAADPGPAPHPPIDPDDPAIIMHTSGTTAAPKGAVMRHADLIFNVTTTIKAQGFDGRDIHLLVNPMFHCTALYSSLPAAACQKTPVVITAESTPDALVPLLARERITTFLTVPTILQRLTTWPDLGRHDLSALKVIGYAGSFMPVKTVRALQKLFPAVELHNFFGLTETISATHVLNGAEGIERPDSIGRPLPFVEAMILGEDGRPAPAGEVGELLFARDNVISGYWGKPDLLAQALMELDGRLWFRTGDLACTDSEGFTFIKGRKKDMIIVGGENVFAAEVETALMALPQIREAAVKGVPATGLRESLGELIKAYVVPEPGADISEADIRRHCRRTLPSYKNPHLLQFLEALPRNPAGKIQKELLP